MMMIKCLKRLARDGLWWLSDRLCAHSRAHPCMFALGHVIGEIGWKLR